MKILFRVRFFDQSEKKPVELLVEKVSPSDHMGMVCLENFVFNDSKKFVILPEEDAARQRFSKTIRLHVPFHSLIFVEEYEDGPADLKNLPFIRELPAATPS